MSGRYPSQKWNSPSNLKASSYHELQAALIAELEDNIAMHPDHDISRRDALRFLASLPIEACGLSALQPVLKYENTELLLQCAAGITACWHLKKGKIQRPDTRQKSQKMQKKGCVSSISSQIAFK